MSAIGWVWKKGSKVLGGAGKVSTAFKLATSARMLLEDMDKALAEGSYPGTRVWWRVGLEARGKVGTTAVLVA